MVSHPFSGSHFSSVAGLGGNNMNYNVGLKTEEHVLRIDERDEEISMFENNEGNLAT